MIPATDDGSSSITTTTGDVNNDDDKEATEVAASWRNEGCDDNDAAESAKKWKDAASCAGKGSVDGGNNIFFLQKIQSSEF